MTNWIRAECNQNSRNLKKTNDQDFRFLTRFFLDQLIVEISFNKKQTKVTVCKIYEACSKVSDMAST